MKNYLLVFMFLTLIACTQSDQSSDNPYVGLWQFPDTSVWVLIKDDGNVYQCRIAVDGELIASLGVVNDNIIIWNDIWGTDQIKKVENSLFLDGQYGEFEYVKINGSMDDNCNNPFD